MDFYRQAKIKKKQKTNKTKKKTIMKSDECKARRKDDETLAALAAFTHHERVQYKSSLFCVSKSSK